MKPQMDKYAIAAALQEIGTLLELKGGEFYKARAYKLGARSIAELSEDIGKLIKENRLTFVKGIGYAIAKQIEELYRTGGSSLLKELRSKFPPGVAELSQVRGLNLKKVEALHKALGISTIEDLKSAAEAGKLRNIKGFGAKTEAAILEAITKSGNRPADRIHIHHALRAAERIIEYLKTSRALSAVELGGSLRRWKETVSQVVIVASAKKPPTDRSWTLCRGPTGMTTSTNRYGSSATAGASSNTRRSARAGTTDSFCANFTPSATSCAQPWNPPAYIGPSRDCMWAIALCSI